MPQDANQPFDQSVLDLIEHSPVGAVPSTPTYQDALKRLYAAHQVYASADHKGGHVTARSLAQAPSFLAANLAGFVAGELAPEALEPNDPIFDRYVASLPAERREKAASHRLGVAGRPAHHRAKHGGTTEASAVSDPVHSLFLVPGTGPHHGLPGNYLYGFLLQLQATPNSGWAVHLHDCDDGAAFFDAATLPEAFAKVGELIESAPFAMSELEALDFRLN